MDSKCNSNKSITPKTIIVSEAKSKIEEESENISKDPKENVTETHKDEFNILNKPSLNESKLSVKANDVVEKSISTEPKSNYLSLLKEKTKKLPEVKKESVPLEILELYQTAEYYKNMCQDGW